MRNNETHARFAEHGDAACPIRFPNKRYAPNHIEEGKVCAVVQLVLEHVRPENDVLIDNHTTPGSGHSYGLTLRHNSLGMNKVHFNSNIFANEEANLKVVLWTR